MRLGQKLILLVLVFTFHACGPGYKTGDSNIKEIKNIHNVTVVKRSKYKVETEKERRKEQRKINRSRWRKQMKR